MTHHYLKIIPEYYEAVKNGSKTFEVRYNDRNFKVNDVLQLQEYDNNQYTGRTLVKVVSYILDDKNFCKDGFVILALQDRCLWD